MKVVDKEYRFEKSLDERSLPASGPRKASDTFQGRRPFGLDACGAHLDDAGWGFDHGIRRSPAEKLLAQGRTVQLRDRSSLPASDLSDGVFRYRVEGADAQGGAGEVRLLAYLGEGPCLHVPAAIDGKPVVSLAFDLFRDLPPLERVSVDAESAYFSTDGAALYSKDGACLVRLVVPREAYAVALGCTAIGERAFDSVPQLREVRLPGTLRTHRRLAFAKSPLAALDLPASVEVIGEKAFYHCVQLRQVTFACGRGCVCVEVAEQAFAFSGVERVELPASLERLGPRAFDQTPAQENVGQGALSVAAENPELRLDAQGGLYRRDVFLELVGPVARYRVCDGTHVVGDGAFKRHGHVREVELPEGVRVIGDEAFRSNRQLRQVRLPESLERIGDRAFLDTGLVSLHLPKRVRCVGESALLVQGDNQLMPHAPLRSLSVDPENPVFYLESGLLCQRGGGRAKGDACLLYVGPDDVVRMPETVTRIAPLAFCGTDGMNELYLHAHLRSICNGAFSTKRTIPLVHVAFPCPIDGYESGDFPLPQLSSRYRSPSYLFDAGPKGTVFDFDYYDSWVMHAALEEFAPAALGRLVRPMQLAPRTREVYENIFRRKGRQTCRLFAEKGDLGALQELVDRDLLDPGSIEAVLEDTMREGRTQATACLLELQHRCQPSAGVDLSL